jgi:hypothetical protein
MPGTIIGKYALISPEIAPPNKYVNRTVNMTGIITTSARLSGFLNPLSRDRYANVSVFLNVNSVLT